MGKTVVITGSSRGLGFEMAKCFLGMGCSVVLSGRRDGLSLEKIGILGDFSGKYIYVQCDVRLREDLQNLWDTAYKKWSGIDIWINNAGRNAPYESVWKTDGKSTGDVIETNLKGMILGSQVAAAGMLKQGRGSIYSMEGLGSNDMIQAGTVIYGTTKRALTYFMKGLARELSGSGVIAGRLSPGMMPTDFITVAPDGKASEVLDDERFLKVFNILADMPGTVAEYLVKKILSNRKNDAHIVWLTGCKAAWRFITAPLRKRKLL